jgi:AAA+ superfamily predicted ATPase
MAGLTTGNLAADLERYWQQQANIQWNMQQQLMQQAQNGTPTKTPPMDNNDLEPPKYLEGDRVTVRTGKTLYTVKRFEEHNNGYRWIRTYFLDSENGQDIIEEEEQLRGGNAKAEVDFDTVIIADEKRNQILEALEQVNQSDLIFEKWGFGKTIEKGKGVSMLFYGPPGTGKTLMAQAIANKLKRKLTVISTADIESSAPGEAERNIRKHFKAAKGAKNILLFDECDSLIYTRQNVGAIMGAQINELLSQIERFDGITVFTTNRLGTLDEAVNRRLALKLEFAMPSQAERAEIWQRMFPEECPLDAGIDWTRLAIVEVSGGYIKNAVLRAARMAAIEPIPDDDKCITMKHLVKALQLETESMIEFENAREEHAHGYGRVVGTTTQRGHGGLQKVQA